MNTETKKKKSVSHQNGDYVCKTCKKRFDTYQALGGHQGTHKKVKISDNNDASNLDTVVRKSLGLHQCKTCMKEFETGQALGGHMRRHRIEKALNLMEKERIWRQQVAVTADGDLVLAAVEPQQKEEDNRHEDKSELDNRHEDKSELDNPHGDKSELDNRHEDKSELVLAIKESCLWRQEAVAKAESDSVFGAVEPQWVKVEEDKPPPEDKTKLILAAKEWRLSV